MDSTKAPEQIIINGREYSPEDATRFVDLGQKYVEMESKLNTSLDKVYPEYSRLSNEKKAWDEERKELEKLRAQQRQAEEEATKAKTPDDVKKARQAARELGLADEDYLKEKGYMTREEVDAYLSQKFSLQEETKKILSNADELERKIDGSDGRVPFDKDAVITYAAGKNIPDLMEAYDKMNERGNAKWKAAQLEREERPGLTTLKTNGAKKQPTRQKMTDDSLAARLDELLNGTAE